MTSPAEVSPEDSRPVPIQLQPYDEFNRRLESQVAPPEWKNPSPSGRYNLVVLGAGTAGLVAAAGAAGVGARVAIIERGLMGGDCLNVGCVPSKGMIGAARVAAAVRDAAASGVHVDRYRVDFAQTMQRMRRLRAEISPHDSAERFRSLGVDVYFGTGKFRGEGKIEVAGQTLEYAKAVIATGSRPARLAIPGLDESGYLTNESVFSLTELPRRIAVLGGGPIGCELAQSFARFGAEVTVIEQAERILSREDPEAAEIVRAAMHRDGVRFLTAAQVVRVDRREDARIVVVRSGAEEQREDQAIPVDAILVATGRAPNVQDLGLETVGVASDERSGIAVDDFLRTTNRRIFAAGDVCSRFQFTHAADFMARIVIRNALFRGRAKLSELVIPWTTYTSPELAQVGWSEPGSAAALPPAEEPIETYRIEMAEVDRAVLDGFPEGFVKIHVRRGTDRIVGATIVAERAGEMIAMVTMAMRNGIGLKKIADSIHPYPTQSDAIRKAGDGYNRTRLTPRIRSLMASWLAWTR